MARRGLPKNLPGERVGEGAQRTPDTRAGCGGAGVPPACAPEAPLQRGIERRLQVPPACAPEARAPEVCIEGAPRAHNERRARAAWGARASHPRSRRRRAHLRFASRAHQARGMNAGRARGARARGAAALRPYLCVVALRRRTLAVVRTVPTLRTGVPTTSSVGRVTSFATSASHVRNVSRAQRHTPNRITCTPGRALWRNR